MKRYQAAGLVLIAFALSLGMAAQAAASLPEFSAPGGFPVKFKGSGGAAKLETLAVHCSSSTSEGELASAKVAKKTIVKFKGCKLTFLGIGFPCQSPGANVEEVITPNLQAKAVYIKETAPKEAGMAMQPESGTTLARLECVILVGSQRKVETIVVHGAVIAKVPTKNAKGEEQYNTELTALEEVFAQEKGKQIPQEYVEEGFKIKASPTCELKFEEGESSSSCGLETSNKLEMAAKVTLKV